MLILLLTNGLLIHGAIMKRILYIFAVLFLLISCGSSRTVASDDDPPTSTETETLEQKNRVALTLLTRIRQIPGIIVRGGVPVFTKTQTDLSGTRPIEPLYILDGYIVGNSFRAVNGLVLSVDVEKIEAFTGPETSFYGSRGAGGVIKITTYQ